MIDLSLICSSSIFGIIIVILEKFTVWKQNWKKLS